LHAGHNLTRCQKNAVPILESDRNVFLTGHAGTGKSFLISHYLEAWPDRKEVPVLASTGVSAVLIGGRTFHSFFGLGTMQGELREVVDRALSKKNVRSRLRRAHTVVVDEVSMLSGDALAAAEAVACAARKNEEPWGGLRLIVVGDFAQLPPVNRMGARQWAFASPVWELSAFEPVILKTVVRSEDEEYIAFLEDVRRGEASKRVVKFLDDRTVVPDDFEGTRLFPLRDPTELFNRERLADLPGREWRFPTLYGGSDAEVENLKRTAPVPEVLHLKEGARVMIRVNDPALRYVNGSVGRVGAVSEENVSVRLGRQTIDLEPVVFSVLDGDGNVKATARNFPLTLAWASTIHKSQGASLDAVLLDLHGLWEPGQAYVALSRVRSGANLFVSRWSKRSIHSDPLVRKFYDEGCPADFASRIEYGQPDIENQ
jgi:ATP-dependent exoDNAse (exonuclease V) alpha subunit